MSLAFLFLFYCFCCSAVLVPVSAAVSDSASISASLHAMFSSISFSSVSSYFFRFPYEFLALGLAALYLAQYWRGSKLNDALARRCLRAVEVTCEAEFAGLGTYEIGRTAADSPPRRLALLKDSLDSFKFPCSGRVNCLECVFSIRLSPRHDLFKHVYYYFAGTRNSLDGRDQLIIEINLDSPAKFRLPNNSNTSHSHSHSVDAASSTVDPMIFCLAQKRFAHSLKKNCADLNAFASILKPATPKSDAAAAASVSAPWKFGFVPITDSPELESQFLFSGSRKSEIEKKFEKFGDSLAFVHVTDQPKGSRTLRAAILLPNSLADQNNLTWAAVECWTEFVVSSLIDRCSSFRLSAAQRQRNESIRRSIEEKQEKAQAKERAAAAAAAAADSKQKAKKEKEEKSKKKK